MTDKPLKPIILYWDTLSGHSHLVRLFLSLLGLNYEIKQVELKKGQHKLPEFLAVNPLGQLPAIDDAGTVLFDSNGILAYLAASYDTSGRWLPKDPAALAEVVRFLSFAAGPVEFGAANARLHNVFGVPNDLSAAQAIAAKYFAILDKQLDGKVFLTGAHATIADVANYTYIGHAPEGGISLEPFAHIRAWLQRVEALPGFVGMQRTAVGLQQAA